MRRVEYAMVAVTRDDASVAILSFITLGRGSALPNGATWEDEASGWWRREPTDANLFQEISRAFVSGPQPTRFRWVQEFEIPTDRTFRDALTDDGAALTHDMIKARAIHLGRVRARRVVKLDQLDRDWMRATGQGKATEAQAIEAQRQALRDLPVTLDVEKAATTEELKALWSPLLE